MGLLDQYQRLEIALELTKGRNKKAREGGYAGGRTTFGYMKQKGEKELIIHDSQAEAVKRVFELKELHKKWSLSRLAVIKSSSKSFRAHFELFIDDI